MTMDELGGTRPVGMCLKCQGEVSRDDVDEQMFPSVHRVCGGEVAVYLFFPGRTEDSFHEDLGWSGIDFAGDSKAVVVNAGGGDGVVLWYEGAHMAIEVVREGPYLDGLGLENAPHGISVWEGKYVPVEDQAPFEYETKPVGMFREPYPDEWAAILKNEPPWDAENTDG
jgi:hypothetical protein